jgi:hypothetical protein
VSWIAHNRLVLEWARYGTYAGTQQAVNTALGGMLRAFRLPDRAVRVRRRLARHRPPGNGGGTMTTLALAPDTRIGYEHAPAAGVDRDPRVHGDRRPCRGRGRGVRITGFGATTRRQGGAAALADSAAAALSC